MIAEHVGQFIRNRILRAKSAPNLTYWARGWRKLERQMLKSVDPVIKHRIGPYTLSIPLSHSLPQFMYDLPLYSRNLGRVAVPLARKYPDMRAIDIGANVGDSAAILRCEATFPILCIEADERYFRLLRENIAQFKDVLAVRAFLGETPSVVEGILETAHGTGHIRASGDGSVHIVPLDELLADHAEFNNARLLKIDTDGFDCKIIRGATSLLARARPIVFFEYDPRFLKPQNDDGLSIFPLFAGLGYSQLIIYDNFGKFLKVMSSADSAGLAELHATYEKWERHYLDICAIHDEDEDVLQEIVTAEQSDNSVPAPTEAVARPAH